MTENTTLGWALWNTETHDWERGLFGQGMLIWIMKDWPFHIASRRKHLRLRSGSVNLDMIRKVSKGATSPYVLTDSAGWKS